MARERRVLRLQQLILEIVAETLQREAEDPRLEMASITRVKLTPDLAHAQIWWSCLARDQAREKTARALEGILPLLQRRVASGLGTRITPHLDLRFDPTLEQAQRLESIFQHLREERGDDEDEVEDEVDHENESESEGPDEPNGSDAAKVADDAGDAHPDDAPAMS